MTMKLFPILCGGFVASFVVAMCMGFLLRNALQLTSRSSAYFEPEVAGIVTLMTLCYVLVHRHSSHLARRQAL